MVPILLKIRHFERGSDEQVWVDVLNRAFKEYEDFRPYTAENWEIWERNPNFDDAGIFIAEWNGMPVGCVNAFVDREREEKKGFIHNLGVIPEYRRNGIGRELLRKAVQSLKERGMELAEAVLLKGKVASKILFESMGFELIRTSSTMAKNLSEIRSNIGENRDIKIKRMTKNNEEEIKLFNNLFNEAFKEHFNFRPETIEETKYWVQHNPWLDFAEYFIGYLENKPIGFIGAGIDTQYNDYQKKKSGWVIR